MKEKECKGVMDWSFYALPSLCHFARVAATAGTAGGTVPWNHK